MAKCVVFLSFLCVLVKIQLGNQSAPMFCLLTLKCQKFIFSVFVFFDVFLHFTQYYQKQISITKDYSSFKCLRQLTI